MSAQLLASSRKRSTPCGEFERSTAAVKEPAVVTHFTLVVWATAGDASDARRSTTVHMRGSASCVKDGLAR